jgi:hypothetical protein
MGRRPFLRAFTVNMVEIDKMNKIAKLSCLATATASLLGGCTTYETNGNPNSGGVYVASAPVYTDADTYGDPIIVPVSTDPIYLRNHGYYYRNGHYYRHVSHGNTVAAHRHYNGNTAVVHRSNTQVVHGSNSAVVRRSHTTVAHGSNGTVVHRSQATVVHKKPVARKPQNTDASRQN